MSDTTMKLDMRTIQKGQWLFSCSMIPLQFDEILEKDPKHYDRNKFTDEEWNEFSADDFKTICGSHHSRKNCSCKLISAEYAKWFLDNKIEELFEKHESQDNRWELYENEVKSLCERDGIKYEGI